MATLPAFSLPIGGAAESSSMLNHRSRWVSGSGVFVEVGNGVEVSVGVKVGSDVAVDVVVDVGAGTAVAGLAQADKIISPFTVHERINFLIFMSPSSRKPTVTAMPNSMSAKDHEC